MGDEGRVRVGEGGGGVESGGGGVLKRWRDVERSLCRDLQLCGGNGGGFYQSCVCCVYIYICKTVGAFMNGWIDQDITLWGGYDE